MREREDEGSEAACFHLFLQEMKAQDSIYELLMKK